MTKRDPCAGRRGRKCAFVPIWNYRPGLRIECAGSIIVVSPLGWMKAWGGWHAGVRKIVRQLLELQFLLDELNWAQEILWPWLLHVQSAANPMSAGRIVRSWTFFSEASAWCPCAATFARTVSSVFAEVSGLPGPIRNGPPGKAVKSFDEWTLEGGLGSFARSCRPSAAAGWICVRC